MSERRQTDETLAEQSISSQSHSSEHWDDRGTSDSVGQDAGNDPRRERARPGDQTLDEETIRQRVAAEGSEDPSTPRQAASVAGMATGMFFTVVILALIAAALILWFLLS